MRADAAVNLVDAAERPTVAFGPFRFDQVNRILSKDGVELPLPPRVLGVLALLLERPGQVVTKQALMSGVWRDAFVTETSLSEAISVLRQTLGDDPQKPTYIQTLHRRGYRFIAQAPSVEVAGRETPRAALAAAATPQVDPLPQLSLLIPWTITLFALLIAASAVWTYLRSAAPPERSAARMAIPLPDSMTLAADAPLAISPDGSLIAFAACAGRACGIYLRPLAQADATLVAGTAGGAAPFFSPDGRWLGYFAQGELRKIAIGGGSPITLAPAAAPLGATWTRDGLIVFAATGEGGLSVVSAHGGQVTPLTTPAAGEGGHRWPDALGDGSAVVFTVTGVDARGDRHYAGVVSLRTGSWSRLLDDVSAARASVPGYLVAQRGADLVGAAFDARTMSVGGLTVTVAPGTVGDAGSPSFAASAAGTLVTQGAAPGLLDIVLNWDTELRRIVPPALPVVR